jgi:hypothetical protein
MFASVVTALVLALARYPGDGPAVSASRRFTVSSEDRADPRARYQHALYVAERGGTNARRVLLEYPRSVSVAWAPDRDVVAVTNHVGSTQSSVSLFVVEPGATFRKVDVAEALYAAFPNLRGELVSYLHVHLELVQWRRDGLVECRLRAYAGAGPELTHRYAVSADGVAKRLSATSSGGAKREQPPEAPPPAPRGPAPGVVVSPGA